jgi:ATP-dependent DNA helicase RecQ
MADQIRQLKDLSIPAALLNSSQSSTERWDILQKLHAGFAGILYVAPERFAAPSFRELLPRLKPRLFVVDEAHCVSFWGHDFRPDYMRLAEVRKALGSPVTAALTATATPQVRSDIATFLQLRSPKVHVTGFDRPNLRYAARYFRTDAEKDQALLRGVKASLGTGIVYCATRKTVEHLSAWLEQEIPGRAICAYHAGMSQPDRKRSQDLFMREKGAVIVATNAFGMGVNKPNIRFVLHYNLPPVWRPTTRKPDARVVTVTPQIPCYITPLATWRFRNSSSARLGTTTISSGKPRSCVCRRTHVANLSV